MKKKVLVLVLLVAVVLGGCGGQTSAGTDNVTEGESNGMNEGTSEEVDMDVSEAEGDENNKNFPVKLDINYVDVAAVVTVVDENTVMVDEEFDGGASEDRGQGNKNVSDIDCSLVEEKTFYESDYVKIDTTYVESFGRVKLTWRAENKYSEEIEVYMEDFHVNGCGAHSSKRFFLDPGEVSTVNATVGFTSEILNIFCVDKVVSLDCKVKVKVANEVVEEKIVNVGQEGYVLRANVRGSIEQQVTDDIKISLYDAYVGNEYDGKRNFKAKFILGNNMPEKCHYRVVLVAADGKEISEEATYISYMGVDARTCATALVSMRDPNKEWSSVEFYMEFKYKDGEEDIIVKSDNFILKLK